MSDIIRLLPDSIANQIAAGEVIQRPASAVKELMENAVDAGASNIQVMVKESGKSLIQVIDDGNGMTATDARMSFERHATSKIRTAEDLFVIRTMGFRGEALASVAAVAQVELKTRTADSELGTLLVIEGSDVKKQEPTAAPKGSSIAIRNLFFNIPARRNFLKSNPVEMKHIIEEFQRAALANPEIEYLLYHNDLEVYNLKKGKLSHRILGLFGKQYREQLAVCREDTPLLSIRGYLGKPEFSKKTRGEQFFFVNKRYIKNAYLNHAVKTGYENLIPDDCHPFYVLFIDIDPQHIDVNVHPTKTEIKFDDERTVYGIIKSAVRQTLGTHNIAPSLDFSHNTNIHVNLDTGEVLNRDFSTSKDYYEEKEALMRTEKDRNNRLNWDQLYEFKKPSHDRSEILYDWKKDDEGIEVRLSSAVNNMQDENNEFEAGQVKMTFQVLNKYIVATIKSGLLLVNQQSAHERILYEKYISALTHKAAPSQQTLFPETIELNPVDFTLALDLKPEIEAVGFVFDIFGKNSVVIQGTPVELDGENIKKAFEGLIEQYKLNKSELSLNKRESVARAMAKQTSIKAGRPLTGEEMNSMIDQLFACGNPNYDPNGNMTFSILDLEKINSFFNR